MQLCLTPSFVPCFQTLSPNETATLLHDVSVLKTNMDHLFLLVMGGIVLFMQLGFALLEASAVRTKNVTNIFVKNVMDMFFGKQ